MGTSLRKSFTNKCSSISTDAMSFDFMLNKHMMKIIILIITIITIIKEMENKTNHN